MQNQGTKKQARQSGVSSLVLGLVFALVATGFFYWDWREQVKFYNVWERGSGLDSKTGNPIPDYQPPPFKFRYERSAFIPLISIFGAVSLLFVFLGIYELRRSRKMFETQEMRERDAKLDAFANSPEARRIARDSLILNVAPIVVLVPVPFMASYGLGIYVFVAYITCAAIVTGALHAILPRMRK